MHNRPIHFEIHADDAERAVKFYSEVFGWQITKWDQPGWNYWMVMTAEKDSKEPGINGGLLIREGDRPKPECSTNAFVCTIGVEDIDEMHNKIIAAGGKVSMPKFDIAGMAWQAYYFDTEGNTFGIHEPVQEQG